MEFKGTKGEWKVSECITNGIKGYEIHWSEDGECVTDHVYDLHDAQLIATAPELLKALQDVLGSLGGEYNICDEAYENAKEVINKALNYENN